MSTLKIFLFLCPFIFSSLIMAQIPSTMSYQGALSDASGSPVADGDYTMTFRLYDSEVSTSSIWDETQVVGVMDGLFETNLGVVTPLDLDFNAQYWLGITVGSSSELSPRIALTASAYSLNAQKVLGSSNIFPSEGNVGIGTLNPLDGALHIVGGENNGIGVSSAALNGVRSHISSGGGYAAGYFTAENSGSYGVWAQSNDYDALYAWSQNSGSTAIRAVGTDGAYAGLFDGVVGINTSTPTNGMLDVAGIISSTTGGFRFPDGTIQTTAATGGTGAGNTLDQAYDEGGAGAGGSIIADAGAVNITGSDGLLVEGSVGIGTAEPTAKLDVIGIAESNSIRSSSSAGGGYAAGNFTASGSGTYGIWAQSNDYDALYAWSQASGSAAIRALGTDGAYAGLFDGVVGINTSTPTNGMLDVAGIISSTTGGFRFPDGTIQTTAASGTGTGNTLDQAYDQGGAGIGRSIDADAGAVNITGSGGLNVGGSIGVGTTDPTARLDVIGISESNTIRANSSAGGGYAAGNFTASGSGTYGIWAQSNDYDAIYAWSQNSGSTAIRALGTDGAYAGLFDGVVGINTSNPENGMLEVTGGTMMSAIAANSSSLNTISSSCSSGGGYAAGNFTASGSGTYGIWAQSNDYDALYAWSQASGSTAIRALGTDGAYAGLFDGVVGINTSNPENGMLEVTGSGFMSAIAANSSSQNTISSDCSSGGGYAAGHFSATGGGTYAIWATSSEYDAIYATAGSSYDAIFANGNITYTGSLTHQSDIRLKENISPLENSLSKLMQLKVKSFYFKNDQQFAHVNFPKGKNFGFIAQEFEKVIPELVTDNINFSSGGDTGSEEESINYKGINYTELIPFLVQAIQEQQEMIDDLKAQVIELQDK